MTLTQSQREKVEQNLGLVGKVIKDKVHNPGTGSIYSYDDLYQIGCIGLCKAAYSDKGGCFSTYAYRLIWNEICTALIYANRRAAKECELIPEIAGHEDCADTYHELDIILERLESRCSEAMAKGMLGINYRKIESNSVGYKTDYEMFSLDFEEFLWAKGYDDSFIAEVLTHMQNLTPFNDVEMSVCSELFLDYCILGGMPAVVREFISKGTFEGSLDIQRQLIADYREDIRKYAEGIDQTRILNVFDHIPVQLAKDYKKFQISKVASGARFRDYRGCIEWLDDASMVNICYCLQFPELPLQGNYDETKYKIYFADSGLLVATLDEEAQEDLRTNKNLGVYKGALYENIVGEALVKAGYKLYYYKREDSTLEQDFFVRTADALIPIEVKAKNGTAKSIRTLINSEKYGDIRCGIKFTGGNIGFSNDIYTFPYFCAFLLKRYLAEAEL